MDVDVKKEFEICSDCSAGDMERIEAAVKLAFELEDYYKFQFHYKANRYNDRCVFDVYLNKSWDAKAQKDTPPRWLAQFTLTHFPAANKLVVANGVSINAEFRHQGHGTRLNSLRTKAAVLAGFSKILCTAVDSNEYETRILERNGWKRISQFDSYNGPSSIWERQL